MSQENSSRISYSAWGLLLALIILTGLLIANIPTLSQAMADNRTAAALLRDWRRESKDISRILCDQGVEPAVAVTENDQKMLINAARRAYFSGDCETALTYWTLASENDPQSETAAIMRFLSAGSNMDMLPEGIGAAETAEFLEALGTWSEQNQRVDDAVYWFANAFEIWPSRSVADSLTRLQQDDDLERTSWQKLAGALPQDDPDHWWALGQQAELAQQFEEAVGYYGTGAQIAPDPFEFLMAQGLLLLSLDKMDEAEGLLRHALSLRPKNSQPYLQLGNIYRMRKDHIAAIDWYEKAVQIAPDKFTQNYRLGREYFVLDEFESAEKYLARAVEVNPGSSSALYFLAQSVYHNGRQSEAQAFLEEAVRRDNESQWNWLVELGDWRVAAGDSEGALKAYYQALRLQPDHPKITAKIEEIENS
jgi:tetratricopeptide (TPR) repeat protein